MYADTLVVSARGEDGGSSGINGNQGDNSLPGSGAAYAFELGCDIDVYGCDTTVEDSLLVLSGIPRLGETMVFGLDNVWAAQTPGVTLPYRPAKAAGSGMPSGGASHSRSR